MCRTLKSAWMVGKVKKPFLSASAGAGLNPVVFQQQRAPLCPLPAGTCPASASAPSDGDLALDYTV